MEKEKNKKRVKKVKLDGCFDEADCLIDLALLRTELLILQYYNISQEVNLSAIPQPSENKVKL